MKNMDSDKKLPKFKITKKGSLGLLAYGDLGFMAWKKVKEAKNENEK